MTPCRKNPILQNDAVTAHGDSTQNNMICKHKLFHIK